MAIDIASLCHVSPGRLRIRVPGRRGDTAYFERVRDRLEALSDIENLRVNPLTGSIIIEHENLTLEALKDSANRDGLFDLQGDATRPEPSAATGPLLATTVASPLIGLLPSTPGETRNLLVLVLVVMALLQLYRGHVMVPAASLLWYAFELSRK